jgi:hypothetical protein
MSQNLIEIASIAAQSIRDQKINHFLSAGAGSVGIAEATVDKVSIIPYWFPLGEIAAIVALAYTSFMFYNTFLDVQFKRGRNHKQQMEISKLDRRSDN